MDWWGPVQVLSGQGSTCVQCVRVHGWRLQGRRQVKGVHAVLPGRTGPMVVVVCWEKARQTLKMDDAYAMP